MCCIPINPHDAGFTSPAVLSFQRTIATLLHSPTGSVFEQDLHQPDFVAVSDWEIPQE